MAEEAARVEKIEAKVERPESFKMSIHTGMLESLGLNMYTSIGKCLVEFVANGYDSDAETVEIEIPFSRIEDARERVRADAKRQVERGQRDKFTALNEPLPEDIRVVIRDDGHGMSPEDVEKRFLVLNRNRRQDGSERTEKGRFVMGRKGLGKLAGFGAAELVTVRTKRRGDDFATSFHMNYNELRERDTLHEAEFPAEYEFGAPENESWTEIVLSRLRCDSLKYREETIRGALEQNFYAIEDDDFRILMNGEEVEKPDVAYEFEWPSDDECTSGFAERNVEYGDGLSFPIRYRVMFRRREGDGNGDGGGEGGHLPASLRGARIYCNKRLAMGPSLLKLHSGMHNFHSQSYMECVVHADELDRHSVDHINTNRTELKSDSDAVDALYVTVTELMRLALRDHAKHREKKTDEQIERSEVAKAVMAAAGHLSQPVQKSTRRLLNMLARDEGIESEFFKQAAPLIVGTMNSGEVLLRLSEMGMDPKSMPVLAHELAELRRIECRDALKLYRARRHAIEALRLLYERAMREKGKGFESELHDLLKENPWLIDPQLAHVLTSDKPMGEVAKALDLELGIDTALPEEYEPETDRKRPDLVFVVTNIPASEVRVVELKSPGIELEYDHLTQLKEYMAKVRRKLKPDHPNIKVTGYLVGCLPKADTSATGKITLLDEIEKSGPSADWRVLSIVQLIEQARNIHGKTLQALENDEERLNEDLS